MRWLEWSVVVVGLVLGYGVGVLHLAAVRRRRAAAWRDRAIRHH